MSEWREMVNFADWLIIHALNHVGTSFMDELRIAVVLLDQATELLMKAYLIKNGYSIQDFDRKKFEAGVKESDKIKKILNEEKTIDFTTALSIIKKILPQIDENGISNFHKLRNKIYHRATRIHEDKEMEIQNFMPKLETFYKLAFNRPFNHADRVLELWNERDKIRNKS